MKEKKKKIRFCIDKNLHLIRHFTRNKNSKLLFYYSKVTFCIITVITSNK